MAVMAAGWRLISIVVALIGAGCLGDGSRSGTASEPRTLASTPSVASTASPFEYAGSTGAQACTGQAASAQCVGDAGENEMKAIESPGQPVRIVANVTWDATSPATEELSVMLMVKGTAGTWEMNESAPMTSGTSPIVIDWDLRAFALASAFAIHVGSMTSAGTPALWAGASLPQAFTVVGEIYSVPATTEGPP